MKDSHSLGRTTLRHSGTLADDGAVHTGRRSADPQFDALALRIAKACNAPIGLITLRTPRVKRNVAAHGMPELVGRPLTLSLDAEATKRPGRVFVVENAATDDRFKRDPMVVDHPKIRFYAGAPIVVGGETVGTICVVDRVERTLSFLGRLALKRYASRAAQMLELRRLEAKTAHGGGLIF